MTNPARLCIPSLLFLLSAFTGCKTPADEGPVEGEWTATVGVTVIDGFSRRIPSPVYAVVTLAGSDRTLNAVVPPESSFCRFEHLTKQTYSVLVESPGYYPSRSKTFEDRGSQNQLIAGAWLAPLPGAAMRIDSISSLVHPVVPQVWLHLYCAESVPAGGYRYAVVFAGLTAGVSPRFGDYVYSMDGISQATGSSDIFTPDFYRELLLAGVPSGTYVYVTARLATGAAQSYRDEATGLWIYSNLEENSRAVTSFVMP